MSKMDGELPERLRSAGGTGLEKRLLRAASSEQPTRELSERMARGIGVTLPAVGAGGAAGLAAKTAAAASKSVATSSALVPWISGTLAAALVVSGFMALRPSATPPVAQLSTAAPPVAPVVVTPVTPTPTTPAASDSALTPVDDALPKGPAAPSLRARSASTTTTTTNELANQIALVDAARAALAAGGPARALSAVREYQATYPAGTFRPEVAAIRIEALLKLGRKTEARALAERFSASYGPGPLADRVARLAGITQP